MKSSVAIIGGSGLNQFNGAEKVRQHAIETPFGKTSALIDEMTVAGCTFYFMPRHGVGHHIPPHKINYRANLSALHLLGVKSIIACNAVGGITQRMGPGKLVLPDQIIDYSYGREHTFSDGTDPDAEVDHIDFTFPYTSALVSALFSEAQKQNIPCELGATYACTQGPRLETAAEIKRLAQDGCDIVGMTAMPEAALARELNIDYASLCLVVNWGAGLTEDLITLNEINRVLDSGMGQVRELLSAWLPDNA